MQEPCRDDLHTGDVNRSHMDLFGKWIWFETERATDVFARARRAFDLPEAPGSAQLLITCSGNYRLLANGAFAGRGPARSPAHKKRYDILEIGPLLRTGRNVLAVQLVHYGYASSKAPATPGGFWCQLEIDGRHFLESDESWRFSIDHAFAQDTERRNDDFGVIEVYDARREDEWLSADWDDADWSKARIVRHGPNHPVGSRIYPWVDLIPRGVPQCREERIRPVAVVEVAEVYDQLFMHQDPNGVAVGNIAVQLLKDVPFEPEFTSIENAESLVSDSLGPAVVKAPSPADLSQNERRCPTIILDFGREIAGYGWIDVEGNSGAIIDVAYGERLFAGRVQAVVGGVSFADRYILKQGRQWHEVYDWKGYRYVQLTFRNLREPLELHGVGATFTSYPVERTGTFECADEKMTEIWRVGAYTQQLCMHDALMDCPWREQAQWLGDGRVQLLIIQNAFGDRLMPRKFVEMFAQEQDSSGQLPSHSLSPGRIVDYSLWWVVAVKDVLLFDGDMEFAGRMVPVMERLFAWYEPFVTADGFLRDPAGFTFIDWADVGREGECAALNLIYHYALTCGADVADAAGRADLAAAWRGKSERIARAFHETFFDEEEQLYADNVVAGRRTKRFSQHTQAMAALTGLAGESASGLLERALAKEGIVETEPYFCFYLVEALACHGLAEVAYEFIRERWGNMLDQGATTFWEEWQVLGTKRKGEWWSLPRSHCHAWSAAPTAWLSRHVLGVRVLSIDKNGILLAPNPCGLSRASGAVPTRFGLVEVEWETSGRDLNVTVKAPTHVEIEFRPSPAFGRKAQLTRRT